MKKILFVLLLCFSFCTMTFAEQDTTILSMPTKCFNAEGILPYIDGCPDEDFERKANGVIINTIRSMVKQIGQAGTFSYSVQLNRSSVVSILLKAQNGNRTFYKSLNLDLTKGVDAPIYTFFVQNEEMAKILGKFDSYIFTDNGVYLKDKGHLKYDRFIPFAKILTNVRIGEAGRLFKIARLTRKSEKKILHIPKNSLFAIQLDSNPTTGYRWNADLPPKGEIIKISSSFIIPNQEKQQTGTPGKEILFFYTNTPGKYDINFHYNRSWEKFNIEQFITTVVVREA